MKHFNINVQQRNDGRLYFNITGNMNKLEITGLLEHAKYKFIQESNDMDDFNIDWFETGKEVKL